MRYATQHSEPKPFSRKRPHLQGNTIAELNELNVCHLFEDSLKLEKLREACSTNGIMTGVYIQEIRL